MKKAKRKAARAAREAEAREKPQGGASGPIKAVEAPTARTTIHSGGELLAKGDGKKPVPLGTLGPDAPNPYAWAGTAAGVLQADDRLIHLPSNTVVVRLDDVPALKGLRLHRERAAFRQYGIPIRA